MGREKQNANLKPIKTKQEATEKGRKGGLIQGINRKKRKDMLECLSQLMKNEQTITENDSKGNIKTVTGTGAELLAVALLRKGIRGDVPALKEVMEREYGKVTEKVETKTESVVVNISAEDLKTGAQELTDILNKIGKKE
jgi:hypothetical protein